MERSADYWNGYNDCLIGLCSRGGHSEKPDLCILRKLTEILRDGRADQQPDAWAWRRHGMTGWALGHLEPTQANLHMMDKPDEWAKVEVRKLFLAPVSQATP